ncbi:VWA domain-containing protein [Luteolibacter yonseiensis]|uniref:VWA domain-containing protein n=1 Tax=Luteolibacter yonseiensis TaxID=1144680 RepID=A0A934R6H6_9BACT|nr:VWA domain-containing protein [Luteolibacter yonseiensis]MBK1817887.1 VWA domain-containing protein [Luteolibacter yonseiensis]
MTFAHPGWLALLILLPILGVGAVLTSRLRSRQWAAFAAPRLRQALVKRGSPLPRWLSLAFLLTASAAIIVAMARPQGDAGTKTEKTVGRNVMIALDISKSMRVTDVKPDRLSQAKVIIYELLEAMPNERMGLIAFAGTAYVHAPLTIDHSAVRETVEQVDENWAPVGGSDLAAAVQLATETLKKTGQKNNALIILSDGEENDGNLEAMIADAEESGVYIITIGVGTENGDHVPDPNSPIGQKVDRSGNAVISRLQTAVLRKLAEETKGRFTVAGSGLDIPAMVNSVVSGLDAFEMDGRQRKISIEFYQWLMFPAILFLITSIVAGTRWKGVRTAVLLGGAFLTLPDAKAGDATDAKAQLESKHYESARDSYKKLAEKTNAGETQARYRLGEATAAYRAQDYRSARTAYSQSLMSEDGDVQASAHLGMGNSLFQLGWKGLSGDPYPTDPESIPDLDRFDTIVKEALAKMRESRSPEEGDSGGYVKFESLITNWADAVRHYDSTLTRKTDDESARQNRRMTMVYLKRLQELLKQEEEETEQTMAQAGQGPPQQGEGDEDPQDGEGDGGEDNPGGKGKNGQDPKDGGGDEGDKKEQGKDGKKDDKEEKGDEEGDNPNESPQERANRILKENSDLEKGPLAPGRRDFRPAEKDW